LSGDIVEVSEPQIPAVVDGTTATELAAPETKKPAGLKWQVKGQDQVKSAVRRLARPLADAIARDANEADTRLLVTDLLREGLGYDTYGDLSTEYQVRGEFADYGIRIDKQLVAFVEVKRATTKLAPKHLRQVEMYAVNEGVEWLILTNGAEWQVYHLSPGMPVVIDLAFRVDLLDTATPLGHRIEKFFYLHRESLRRRQIDELWKMQAATSPKQIAEVLRSDAVLQAAMRELRRRTGQRVAPKELAHILNDTVLRPECFERAT
jgi:Type I restriction enzyme R protein N terminus (HSDR_N)